MWWRLTDSKEVSICQLDSGQIFLPCHSLLAASVSELAVEEGRRLSEQLAEEKELRVRVQQEVEEVGPVAKSLHGCSPLPPQAQQELRALSSRGEDKAQEADQPLRDALAQLESIQHALDLERKERASMEEELKTQLQLQQQQPGLAEENSSKHLPPLSPAPSLFL